MPSKERSFKGTEGPECLGKNGNDDQNLYHGSSRGEGVMGEQGREVVGGEGFLGSRRRIFMDLQWATSKTMWKK